MSRDIQAPMPVSMRDQTNIALQAVRGEDARYLIRRLVADAYATGFADGGIDQRLSSSADREAEAEYRRREATPDLTDAQKQQASEAASDWSDFRKEYGVSADGAIHLREHRAFVAGWVAGHYGDQSGPLS